jgi:hypothetical protein
MTDYGAGTEGEDDSSIIVPLRELRRERDEMPVTFHRRELDLILRVYGRKVALGEWRDYAIDHTKDRATFSVYRRTSEVPLYQIDKTPAGLILKRGHELARVLAVFDEKPRLVRA